MARKRVPKSAAGTCAHRWQAENFLATGKFRVRWPARNFAVLETNDRPVLEIAFDGRPEQPLRLPEDISKEEKEEIIGAYLQVARLANEGHYDQVRLKASPELG